MRSLTGTETFTPPKTTVPVQLRCLACGQHTTILVATRGRLAGMTTEQRAILDLFTLTHAATQIVT